MHVGQPSQEPITFDVVTYDAAQFSEITFGDREVNTCYGSAKTEWVSRVKINGIHEVEHIETLVVCFGLRPLVLEDVLNSDHRPKSDGYGNAATPPPTQA